MTITITELKKRLAYYLTRTKTEAIAITKRGRVIAYLASPKEERLALINSLAGSLPRASKKEKINQSRPNAFLFATSTKKTELKG